MNRFNFLHFFLFYIGVLRAWLTMGGAVLALSIGTATWASPGAHGPNGEHLDSATPLPALTLAPSFETHSVDFELVGQLQETELSLLIQRFATNEPVLDASVEVETGSLKAQAVFHADLGDYAIDDAQMLKALAVPGEHALVITLRTGQEADLLDATLTVASKVPDTRPHSPSRTLWLVLALVTLLVLVVLAAIGGFFRRQAQAKAQTLGVLLLCTAALNAWGLTRLPDGSVQISMLAQRRLGIRTQLSVPTQAAASVELSGRVIVDPNASGRVQAVHGGRIEAGPSGLPVAGQSVRRGQVLAYVSHHAEPYALANQKAQWAQLRSDRALAAQRLQRLESLTGTVPGKDIDAARAELHSLTAREQSIGASLVAKESLRAPVSGVIARAEVAQGQVVQEREMLFEVIDPERVLVEASTSDPSLPTRIARASLQAHPGIRLQPIGAARSLRDGVLPITFKATPEKAGRALPLAIGQPVTVVATLTQRITGMVLPAQAVVRNSANEPIVWIKSGAQRYLPQPVQYQALDAQTVVITQGLGAENRVVVQGAALLAQIR